MIELKDLREAANRLDYRLTTGFDPATDVVTLNAARGLYAAIKVYLIQFGQLTGDESQAPKSVTPIDLAALPREVRDVLTFAFTVRDIYRKSRADNAVWPTRVLDAVNDMADCLDALEKAAALRGEEKK